MALFDTLKAARRLQQAGFDEEKAGAIVSAFAEDIGERVATREDVRRVEGRLDHLQEQLVGTEERLQQHLTVRMGMMVTAATGILLAAMGIATGFIVST